MTPESREDAILSRVREQLLAEGYDVVVHPNRLGLPTFLGDFVPDALAYGKEKNLVVEVATQSPRTERRVARLRELVEQQPEWDLRLIWTTTAGAPRSLPTMDEEGVVATLDELQAVLNQRQPRAALLLAWGCLEALARILLPDEIRRPQTPIRVVDKLASAGFVTPLEAHDLRELAQRRNRLIHGDLRTDVRRKHVTEMLALLQRLFADLKASAHPSDAEELSDPS